ncbi:hypothetical protein ACLKA7_008245 [Drosophila subpalustris]
MITTAPLRKSQRRQLEGDGCAQHVIQISSSEQYCWKEGLAYTEDDVLIKKLFFFVDTAKELGQQQFQKYFEKYGCVERLDLYPSESGRQSGHVTFANPCDAAEALRRMCQDVNGRINVRPSYSWHQPDAEQMPQRPENVDPNEPAAIMKLNDYCLGHIFSLLSLRDRIHFARTCYRFLNIYEGMSPSLDKSITFELFEGMTAWEFRLFFQLSGRNIKKIKGTRKSQRRQLEGDGCAQHVIQISSSEQYCWKGELAYTEDDVLIKKLFFFVDTAKELGQQQFQKYFEKYGCVERLDLYQRESGRQSGHVTFANPCDAAEALRRMCQDVSGRINVRPSYSWHQPDAEQMPQRPENVDPNEPAAIMKLNDYCLGHIFSLLSLRDRIHFARTCYRFLNIYEGMLPLLKELRLSHYILSPDTQCKSLEILSFYYNNDILAEYEPIARLPRLKKLILEVVSLPESMTSPKLISWLVEHKSKQLQHLEIDATWHGVHDELLLEIGKLIALHTLIFRDDNKTITNRGLGGLFTLQALREIHIINNKNITDEGVLGLILACPKLQVLNLENCSNLTDKLLRGITLTLQNNQYNRPLPIKLYMPGTQVSQSTLLNADVTVKNIIDLCI